MVQGFFARLIERDVIGRADPARGRFRAFLRVALRNYARNVRDAEMSAASGGGITFVDADCVALANGAPSAEALYDRLWARALLDRALARLGDEQARAGKGGLLEALRDRLGGEDDEARPLRDVAAGLGMREGAVKVALFRLRRRFAELVRAEVAETVARPEDVDAELRDLRAAFREDR